MDAVGNLYIADTGNNVIREVDTNGIISTVIGGGTNESGTGETATNALLDQPSDVAVDPSGNVYFAQKATGTMYRVDTSGNLQHRFRLQSPIFGNCPRCFGNLSVTHPNDSRIWELTAPNIFTNDVAGDTKPGFAGDGGLGSLAEIDAPCGLAFDLSGNFYIADYTNQRIREVQGQGPARTILGVTAAKTGAYDVIIVSPSGVVTSAPAFLRLALPPAIVVPPTNQIILPGSNGVVAVAVSGTPPFSYQWWFNGSHTTRPKTNDVLLFGTIFPNEFRRLHRCHHQCLRNDDQCNCEHLRPTAAGDFRAT